MARTDDLTVGSAIRSYIRRGLGAGEGPDRPARKITNRRVQFLFRFVLAVALLLGLRLFYLQVVQAHNLSETAREFRSRTYPLEAKRGNIVDAHGAVLATSIERYNVRADQVEISSSSLAMMRARLGAGPSRRPRFLAPVLGADQPELGGKLLGGERKSSGNLSPPIFHLNEWRAINALGVKGIYPERFMQRQYPGGTTAGTILGYLGQTEDSPTPVGRAGIEQQYDDVLAGTEGRVQFEVAAGGSSVPELAAPRDPGSRRRIRH